jgi:hypothetical protein
VVVDQRGSTFAISRNGSPPLVDGATIAELIAKADKVHPSPLSLGRGTSVTFDIPGESRAKILEAFAPPDSEFDALVETAEEMDFPFEDVDPIDVGIHIDGNRWGWAPLDNSYSAFGLSPIGESDLVADFNAWMSASMTGVVLDSGARRWGDIALQWLSDDSDVSWQKMIYNVDDWTELLDSIVLLDGLELCPACESDEPSGWVLNLTVSPIYSSETLGRVIANVWRPCEAHRGMDCPLEFASLKWKWGDGVWREVVAPAP